MPRLPTPSCKRPAPSQERRAGLDAIRRGYIRQTQIIDVRHGLSAVAAGLALVVMRYVCIGNALSLLIVQRESLFAANHSAFDGVEHHGLPDRVEGTARDKCSLAVD